MSLGFATNASWAGFIHLILFSIRFYFQNYSIYQQYKGRLFYCDLV